MPINKSEFVGDHRRSLSAPTDDSDLEDLIAKSPDKLEIDSSNSGNGAGGFLLFTPCYMISGGIRLCCYNFPCLSKCTLAVLALGFIAFLSNTFSPYQKMGIMGADYSAITSAYDLSLSKVDHWCIQGDNDSCKCEDPLEPNSRSEFKSWNAAHKANVADVNLYRAVYGEKPTMIDEDTGKARPPIDVAFLGESVVEAMDGRWLGKRVVRQINKGNGAEKEGEQENAKGKPDIGKVFERMFRKEKGGPVEGVALGVAGDNTANVLWRLQHDEMPYDFNPKVWWLVLGMNDLTRMQCSEEIVVLGILRIVEEIRLRKPDAKIVINSLLPMIDYQSMKQPTMADVADFKREKNNAREKEEIEKGLKNFFGDKSLEVKNAWDGTPSGAFKEHGWGGRLLRSKKDKRKKRKGRKHRHDEDDATEGVELEEALERKEKDYEKRDKKISKKEFKDNEKYRPKKPLSPFLPMIKKKVLPPVWPSVHLINDKLKEFCSKHDSITFFDATPIFATDEGGGRHHMHNELISPRGHPSELGFAVWEGHIMGRLHKLIAEKQVEIDPNKDRGSDDDYNDDEQGGDVYTANVEIEGGDSDGGEGSDHVSDGKESDPPQEDSQPSRDQPSEIDEEVVEKIDEKENRNGDEHEDVKEGKQFVRAKAKKEQKESSEDGDDDGNGGDDDDDEEE